MKNFIVVSLFYSLICSSIMAETLMNPTSLSKDLYSVEILDGNYSSDIDEPSNFLNFNYGERVASPAQISAAVIAWSKQSERLKVVEYAISDNIPFSPDVKNIYLFSIIIGTTALQQLKVPFKLISRTLFQSLIE